MDADAQPRGSTGASQPASVIRTFLIADLRVHFLS
jgi:hypothetical protein